MSTKKIIVDIPFNINFTNYFDDASTQAIFNKSFSATQQKDWIDYRIDIFMKYTGNCLINQTNQNFTCYVRYSESTEDLIFEALSKYPKLPDNIIFISDPTEYISKAVEENDYLYHVNIDSDNMYDIDFIDQLDKFDYVDGVECLLCHDGYIYDSNTDRLAKITHFSPSLYVYVYTKRTYKMYFKKRLFEPHALCQHKVNLPIPGRTYMIITHVKNLDNNFDLIKNWLGDGSTVEDLEKEEILTRWHIR